MSETQRSKYMEFSRSHVKPSAGLCWTDNIKRKKKKRILTICFEMKQYTHSVTAEGFNDCFTITSNKEGK